MKAERLHLRSLEVKDKRVRDDKDKDDSLVHSDDSLDSSENVLPVKITQMNSMK